MKPFIGDPSIFPAVGGFTSSGCSAVSEDAITTLAHVLPRLEDMLNTGLVEAGIKDVFDVTYATRRSKSLLLTRGFVDESTLVATDSNGLALLPSSYTVDAPLGVVYLSGDCICWPLTISYTAGFAPSSGSQGRMTDAPSWMEAIAYELATHHKAMLTQTSLSREKTKAVVSDVNSVFGQDILARARNRYQRPRYDMLFPVRSNTDE